MFTLNENNRFVMAQQPCYMRMVHNNHIVMDKYMGKYRIPTNRLPNHVHGLFMLRHAPVDDYTQASTNHFGPQTGNLASVVRGFKAAVTSYARANNISFQWQSRYYDQIIFNERQLASTIDYINGNIANWHKDELY